MNLRNKLTLTFAVALCLVLTWGAGESKALVMGLTDLQGLAGGDPISHPDGEYGPSGAVSGSTGVEYFWDLHEGSPGAYVVLSTDHMSPESTFTLDVYGSNEPGTAGSWAPASFTGLVYGVVDSSLDEDDYALKWMFNSEYRFVGVNSYGTIAMSLAEPYASHPALAEYDGVASVPEPSTMLLMAGGALGVIAYGRRRLSSL